MIFQRRRVDDSKYGKFISLRGCRRLPSVGDLLCLPLECRALSLDIVLPEREASEGVKLDNDELNSLMKYGMGCGAAWLKARPAN